jgi:hypothetical protein
MLQHVRRRSNGLLANLVHADRVPAVLTNHGGVACDGSSPDVHALRLRFKVGSAESLGSATFEPHTLPCVRLPTRFRNELAA